MILRLWKNRQITRSNTHLWNRLDSHGLADVLLAVVLLMVFVPWVNAEERSSRSSLHKLRSRLQTINEEDEAVEAVPSPEATERWKQLQSRYQPQVNQSEEQNTSVSKSRAANLAPVRPIPEDLLTADSDESSRLDTKSEPPDSSDDNIPLPPLGDSLPIGNSSEPNWVYGQIPPGIEDLSPADKSHAAPQRKSSLRRLIPQSEVPRMASAKASSTAENDVPANQPSSDPAYTPRSGARRPRTIHEIRPTYDKTLDQDIREYARQQALQYKVNRQDGLYPPRMFPGLAYLWEPSNLSYYSLYFEDPALERYGHTLPYCMQPVASITRFSVQLVGLPYQMAIDSPCCLRSSLGWYRPGDCVPKLHYQIPLSAHGAVAEAGVVTGLFFAIP